MTLEQIKDYDIKGSNVLILGMPASGKTHLCNQLDHSNHVVIHTDDYMHLSYDQAMYAALMACHELKKPFIVEGIQCYRLLRKSAELGYPTIDIVIEIEVSRTKREEIYRRERDPKKIAYLNSFAKANTKILNDYFDMVPKEDRGIWLYYQNLFEDAGKK